MIGALEVEELTTCAEGSDERTVSAEEFTVCGLLNSAMLLTADNLWIITVSMLMSSTQLLSGGSCRQ
jgi:hypothetical protein